MALPNERVKDGYATIVSRSARPRRISPPGRLLYTRVRPRGLLPLTPETMRRGSTTLEQCAIGANYGIQ